MDEQREVSPESLLEHGSSAYQYKDLPLTPSIAALLTVELLSAQAKPISRVDITRYVSERHRTLGGQIGRDPLPSMKKALTRLVRDGKVRRNHTGYYSLAVPIEAARSFEPKAEVLEPHEMTVGVVPENVTGEGEELVYVYFHQSDRELAVLKKRDLWPCKVGFTAGNLTTRILGQGAATSMARMPIVGLVIKTADGQDLERALHLALDEAGVRIDDAIGYEWFETSPRRIMDWYQAHQRSIETLRQQKSG